MSDDGSAIPDAEELRRLVAVAGDATEQHSSTAAVCERCIAEEALEKIGFNDSPEGRSLALALAAYQQAVAEAAKALERAADVADRLADSRESVDHRRLVGVDPAPLYDLEYEVLPQARAALARLAELEGEK